MSNEGQEFNLAYTRYILITITSDVDNDGSDQKAASCIV